MCNCTEVLTLFDRHVNKMMRLKAAIVLSGQDIQMKSALHQSLMPVLGSELEHWPTSNNSSHHRTHGLVRQLSSDPDKSALLCHLLYC